MHLKKNATNLLHTITSTVTDCALPLSLRPALPAHTPQPELLLLLRLDTSALLSSGPHNWVACYMTAPAAAAGARGRRHAALPHMHAGSHTTTSNLLSHASTTGCPTSRQQQLCFRATGPGLPWLHARACSIGCQAMSILHPNPHRALKRPRNARGHSPSTHKSSSMPPQQPGAITASLLLPSSASSSGTRLQLLPASPCGKCRHPTHS